MKISHEHCFRIVVRLPTDYQPWGEVHRWEGAWNGCDPDCSTSCKFWWNHGGDWGTCCNPASPRHGLLTFEHQAGRGCYQWSRVECVFRGPTDKEIAQAIERIGERVKR